MKEVLQLLIEKEFSKKSPGYYEEFQAPFDIEDLIAEIMETGRYKNLTVKKIMESEYRERFEALLSSPTRRGLKAFVTRLPDSYTHCAEWYSLDDRVGSVGSVSLQIDSAIAGKSKKLSDYKENSGLDDIRLLIVADHLRASGMLELRDYLEFDSQGFQVVYFLNHPKSAHVISRVRKAA